MGNKRYVFDAVIKKHDKVNAGFIEFPYNVKKEFGKGRVKVKALLDGVPYQGSLVKMGGDFHWLGITQDIRQKTGKNPGDILHVELEEETGERSLDIPADLLLQLEADKKILEYFSKLSFTHRKEYVNWINEAKKEETRKNRIARTVEMLKSSIKSPQDRKKN